MKPGDFFLGVLDFFAILLPGSLATWLAIQYVSPSTLRAALTFEFMASAGQPDKWVVAAAFVLSSYLLGHFVYMAGSRLDWSYDRWRPWAHTNDTTFDAADELRKELTPELAAGELTTLKWARAYIQVESAEARVEIDRLEAEQKFFRSLVVVASMFAAHFILRERALFAGAVAVPPTNPNPARRCRVRVRIPFTRRMAANAAPPTRACLFGPRITRICLFVFAADHADHAELLVRVRRRFRRQHRGSADPRVARAEGRVSGGYEQHKQQTLFVSTTHATFKAGRGPGLGGAPTGDP